MSEHLQAAKVRGDEARRLMEDDGILAFAIREAKKVYINEWTQTAPFETQKREQAYIKLNMIGDIEAMLQKIMGDGAEATRQIKAFEQKQKRGL